MIPDISILAEEYQKNPVTPGPFFIVTFGKFKHHTVLDIYKKDQSYLDWLQKNNENRNLKESIKILKTLKYNYYCKNLTSTLEISDIKLSMGRYKGYNLSRIFKEDVDYCIWIISNGAENENYFKEWFIAQKYLETLLYSKKEISIKNDIPSYSIDNTVKETLNYLKNGIEIEDIAKIRNLSALTIEGHISKIIELGLLEIKEDDIKNFPIIKETIFELFGGDVSKIKPIKEHLENSGIEVEYRHIKFTISLLRRNKIIN